MVWQNADTRFFTKLRWQPYLSFVLITGCLIIHHDYILIGKVYSADGMPLEGVKIMELDDGTGRVIEDTVTTDTKGQYQATEYDSFDCSGVKAGNLVFQKEGYKDFIISVRIEDDMPKTLDIIMERTDSALDSRIK